MRILTEKQGDDKWELARKGRITASSIGHVLAGKGTKSRFDYLMQLCMDLEGIEDFKDSAHWFEAGREYEGHARGWYDWNVAPVKETGFVLHDEYNWLGASPDGLVGDDGCIEIKYRKTLKTFHDSNVKPIGRLYESQMQTVMWVCNRQWCDYVNYWRDDRFEKEQAHVRRIVRDEGRIRELEDAAVVFWADVLKLFVKRTERDSFLYPFDDPNYGKKGN
jgi:putative phage-type endonuclease